MLQLLRAIDPELLSQGIFGLPCGLMAVDFDPWWACRRVFEPFGGMKSAVIAARDNEPGDSRLKLTGFNGDLMTSDPEYEAPLVKEVELVLVVFDILYVNGQVRIMPPTACLQHRESLHQVHDHGLVTQPVRKMGSRFTGANIMDKSCNES